MSAQTSIAPAKQLLLACDQSNFDATHQPTLDLKQIKGASISTLSAC